MSLTMVSMSHKGKANDLYTTENSDFLIIDHSDRISAENGKKTGVILGKGKTNNSVSALAFESLEKAGIETHFISIYSDTAMLIKKAKMIMLEVICRNKTAGSFSKRFGCKNGMKIFPAGVEFCFKDNALGDPFMPLWAIPMLGCATAEEVILMEQLTLKVNDVLIQMFDKLELDLFDFKLEFGRLEDGSIVVCDEISLDTCRLIDPKTGENMDKDRFRNNLGKVQEAYMEVLNRL